MLFALICTDRPASFELRAATRPSHIAFLETYASKLVEGGALLDPEGRPDGFASADPYAKAGLFESTIIRPFRGVFKDGRKVA
jgi:uncharacterized protein YciI